MQQKKKREKNRSFVFSLARAYLLPVILYACCLSINWAWSCLRRLRYAVLSPVIGIQPDTIYTNLMSEQILVVKANQSLEDHSTIPKRSEWVRFSKKHQTLSTDWEIFIVTKHYLKFCFNSLLPQTCAFLLFLIFLV